LVSAVKLRLFQFKEWILIQKYIRQDLQDHQDRRALGYLAAGEKNPINPVNPVKKKKLKIESIQHSVSLKPVVSFSVKLPQWRG